MKIREFRRQIPNNKLRPINKKDNKVNMSVDAKLMTELDEEPLIEPEEGKFKKKPLPTSKPKHVHRKIIRDASHKLMNHSQSAHQATKPENSASSRNHSNRNNTVERKVSNKSNAPVPKSQKSQRSQVPSKKSQRSQVPTKKDSIQEAVQEVVLNKGSVDQDEDGIYMEEDFEQEDIE
mmetsp:Transcript_17052/g.16273  ORF Transcript_17052/g.16273 Transcript_17052/m.16273 type:complete len:178 (+) Transcript_17052:355-888(+)